MEPTTKSVQSTTMTFPRFGEVTYAETDVIEFPWGMPGFSGCRRWLFLTLDAQPNYVWLQSLDDVSVALPAASPRSVFESYNPNLPPAAFVALEIDSASDFTTVCTVVVGHDAREMTMNLAAPILINLRLRKALQITLGGGHYSSHEVIPRTLSANGTAPLAHAS